MQEIDGFVVVVLQIGEHVQMLSGCWQGSRENVLSLLSAMISSNSHANLLIFKLAVYTCWLAFPIVFLVASNNICVDHLCLYLLYLQHVCVFKWAAGN